MIINITIILEQNSTCRGSLNSSAFFISVMVSGKIKYLMETSFHSELHGIQSVYKRLCCGTGEGEGSHPYHREAIHTPKKA